MKTRIKKINYISGNTWYYPQHRKYFFWYDIPIGYLLNGIPEYGTKNLTEAHKAINYHRRSNSKEVQPKITYIKYPD